MTGPSTGLVVGVKCCMEACPPRYELDLGRDYQPKEVVVAIYNRRHHRTATEDFLIAGGGRRDFSSLSSAREKLETMKIYPLCF